MVEAKYGLYAEQIAESIPAAAMFACINRIPTLFDYHRKMYETTFTRLVTHSDGEEMHP